MRYTRTNKGTCSARTTVEIDEQGIITDVVIEGGCSGNLKGVSALAKGRPAKEVIETLKGLTCGGKNTSCPDQLSKCIEEALNQ